MQVPIQTTLDIGPIMNHYQEHDRLKTRFSSFPGSLGQLVSGCKEICESPDVPRAVTVPTDDDQRALLKKKEVWFCSVQSTDL